MLSETANLSLSSSRDKKVSIKFYEYNACKDLEKEYILCAGIIV